MDVIHVENLKDLTQITYKTQDFRDWTLIISEAVAEAMQPQFL